MSFRGTSNLLLAVSSDQLSVISVIQRNLLKLLNMIENLVKTTKNLLLLIFYSLQPIGIMFKRKAERFSIPIF